MTGRYEINADISGADVAEIDGKQCFHPDPEVESSCGWHHRAA
jgi:hypothetical protein